MTTHLKIGDKFPDIELPSQDGKLKRLSHFTQPSQMDQLPINTDLCEKRRIY